MQESAAGFGETQDAAEADAAFQARWNAMTYADALAFQRERGL